jgi:iron(III) transport system substrate-binding protein
MAMSFVRARDGRRCWLGKATVAGVGLYLFVSLVAGGAALTLVPQPALAAASKEKTAAGSFEQEWAKLVAAAKQEGTLAIGSGGSPSRQFRPITDEFQKKFGIKVEMSTGSGNATVTRILAERKAGRYTMDVALVSLRASTQRLVPAGALVPFAPLLIHPEVVDGSGWYLGRHWYADRESKYVFIYHVEQENEYEVWYNTEKIKEAEIGSLKKQTDFFDPRWKGKIAGEAMEDGSGIRTMVDSYFEPDRGPEWIRTYLLNAGVTFSNDRRILETWLVGGRFPLMAVPIGASELIVLEKKGLPIKQTWMPKQAGYMRAGGSGCCISAFANAPHPNAAKLFVNWFLSKEGQTLTHTMIPNLDRSSLREDIPAGEVLPEERRKPGVKYLFPDADPSFGPRQQEAQKWILKIWESRQR